ncbi:MAG: PilT protein domain protein [Ignavibacteria bacterium]|nr:PilT protein domain protein [Ignavibacteria bacterium]
MKIILDTHALIWDLEGNSKLSSIAKDTIENLDNNILLSIASLWEMSIKIKLNKLTLKIPLTELKSHLNQKKIEILPIVFEDIIVNSTLENHHNDPFDRIIISQSINNYFPVITNDKNFKKYGVDIIW